MTSPAQKDQEPTAGEQNRATQPVDRRVPHHGIVYTDTFLEGMKRLKADPGRKRIPAA